MPKQVDHHQRRGEISAAVCRLAVRRGLAGVSFREVAAEAGVSVSLIQHYFGTKEQLLIDTVNLQSAALGASIMQRITDLDPAAAPLDRVRAVVAAFVPSDDESRDAMLLYLSFAAAALTDPALRDAEAFRSAFQLTNYLRGQLATAREQGQLAAGLDPDIEAQTQLALVLGMSLTVLLDGASSEAARRALDAHIDRLQAAARRRRRL